MLDSLLKACTICPPSIPLLGSPFRRRNERVLASTVIGRRSDPPEVRLKTHDLRLKTLQLVVNSELTLSSNEAL